MTVQTSADLRKNTCKPCEGGTAKMSHEEVRQQLAHLDGWQLSDDGNAIHKSWTRSNFQDGLSFINRIGQLAESEQHHPDLQLSDYKTVRVRLTTHAIGGLSENDFIIAAKIDEIR